MSQSRMVDLPCWPFELSPLNELYKGKLVRSKTHIPFEIFDDIWYTCISGQDDVSRARVVALLCWPFELSPLDELYRGKLVRYITLIPSEIFWWYLVYMYIRSRRCVMWKNGCFSLLAFWVISLEWTLKGKDCVLNKSYYLWDMLMILGKHVYQVKTMRHMHEWMLPFVGL